MHFNSPRNSLKSVFHRTNVSSNENMGKYLAASLSFAFFKLTNEQNKSQLGTVNHIIKVQNARKTVKSINA